MQERYSIYYAHRPRLNHPSLNAQYERLILPGLALYQTLHDHLGNQDAALLQTEPLFRAVFFADLARYIPLLKYLPDAFPLVRFAMRHMSRSDYLPGSAEVLEDSPDCFAVNVHRCFIIDALAAYQAPELAALFCKTDDWLAEARPANITWERTTTLARGGPYCDFCWRRFPIH